ncbi:Electron transfer flavoprotein alpha-subunit [Perkinsus olseni]|uniref:Electron transfer flavoprotein alpha-subunit n=2 Tax=Perkinsus olseni TaxID=32597 RepID=A0A7J6PQ00_PEROL|nr:Electron transfer flavoprotein alpha-subunit [Perkinsus olseni]
MDPSYAPSASAVHIPHPDDVASDQNGHRRQVSVTPSQSVRVGVDVGVRPSTESHIDIANMFPSTSEGDAIIPDATPNSEVPQTTPGMNVRHHPTTPFPVRAAVGLTTPPHLHSTGARSQQDALSQGQAIVTCRKKVYQAEILLYPGKKVRGPKRQSQIEAEQDKFTLERAKMEGNIEEVLVGWDLHSQLLPKGVYYHKRKKAYIASINISAANRQPGPLAAAARHRELAQALSATRGEFNGHMPPAPVLPPGTVVPPKPTTAKIDGPARQTLAEAISDRAKMESAASEEELMRIVHELRGPKARSTKRKSLNPDEKLPAGVYFKPESNCYQAQVSVNRRNIRGPPRQTLEEAISDRQRLLVAKAQGRAEEEVVLLKVDYQRTLALEGCVGGLMPGERSTGDRRARGRPKGSVSGANRFALQSIPPGGMMLPPPPPGMFPSAAEGGPPFNLPLFFAAQAAQQGATPEAEVPHTDYSTGTAEQILLLNQYIQQAAGVLADDNNVNSEATAAGGPAVPHEAHEDRSSSEAVVPSADPSGSSSAPPPPPTDTANDVVQAMLAASGMLDAANAAAAAAGVDPGNGQEIGGSMAPADANGDGDSGRPHKMQRVS